MGIRKVFTVAVAGAVVSVALISASSPDAHAFGRSRKKERTVRQTEEFLVRNCGAGEQDCEYLKSLSKSSIDWDSSGGKAKLITRAGANGGVDLLLQATYTLPAASPTPKPLYAFRDIFLNDLNSAGQKYCSDVLKGLGGARNVDSAPAGSGAYLKLYCHAQGEYTDRKMTVLGTRYYVSFEIIHR